MQRNGMGRNKWILLLMVIFGNLIYAFAVKLFILPAQMVSCGTTGIALVVNHLTGIPVPTFILIFNVIMLGLGWWILGRQFAMTTILSSLFYPVALDLLNRLLGDLVITRDPLLNAVFGGLGIAFSYDCMALS